MKLSFHNNSILKLSFHNCIRCLLQETDLISELQKPDLDALLWERLFDWFDVFKTQRY